MLHLNNNSNVTVLHAKGLFYAYHDFLSSFFKDPFPGHIHNYHYFGFRKSMVNKNTVGYKKSWYDNHMLSYDLYKIPPGVQREERSRQLLNGKPIKLDEPGIPYMKKIHMFKQWRKVVPEEYWEDTCPVPSRVNGIEEAPVRILGEHDNLITNWLSTDVNIVN